MGKMKQLWKKYQKHLHDKLGYGYPTERNGGDGFQPNYGCRFCPYNLAQDSQGNYFHLSSNPTLEQGDV